MMITTCTTTVRPPPLVDAAVLSPSTGACYSRKITSSMLKGIMCIQPQNLKLFGWSRATAPEGPLVAFWIDGWRLAVNGQAVMRFNKEGRDGFPLKNMWVKIITKKLGLQIDDTFVWTHRGTESATGIIHVDMARVVADTTAAAEQSWTKSATWCTQPPGECGGDDDDVQSEWRPSKRRRFAAGSRMADLLVEEARELSASPSPRPPTNVVVTGDTLVCRHCGREYKYRLSFIKHQNSCTARDDDCRDDDGRDDDGRDDDGRDDDGRDDDGRDDDGRDDDAIVADALMVLQVEDRAAVESVLDKLVHAVEAAEAAEETPVKVPVNSVSVPAVPAVADEPCAESVSVAAVPSVSETTVFKLPSSGIVKMALKGMSMDAVVVEHFMMAWETMTAAAQHSAWKGVIRECMKTNNLEDLDAFLRSMV